MVNKNSVFHMKLKKGWMACSTVVLCLSLVGCGTAKKVELKNTEFEVLVNKELDLQATTYFEGAKKDDRIVVKKSSLDIKKIGDYELTITYDKKSYDIKVKVTDKEKPVLNVKKLVYCFDLKTSTKAVNEQINKDIVITDNYDTSFGDIEIIKDIPKEEREVVVKLAVEDSSKNKSDEVEIKIQFTKDGKEKTNLKREENSVTAKVEEKKKETASSTNGDSSSNKNEGNKPPIKDEPKDDSSSGNKKPDKGPSDVNPDSGGGTPPPKPPAKPTEPPKPPVKPTPPTDKPEKPPVVPEKPTEPTLPKLTVDNYPSYALGNSGRVFATRDEAYEWANSQVTKEGSPWFGYTMDLTQAFLPNFQNNGQGADCPVTVQFW